MTAKRVSVYTIALNEEKHVERFMSCLKGEADDVYVLDTGSTDKTVEALRDHGAHVKVGITKPWRFDIPRNISLAMVPESTDICLSIDLDEVLTPGWRSALEAAWTPETTRMRYQYAWSHNADGSPATLFWYDKAHQRKNYRWVKPVHEVLNIYNQPEVQTYCEGFMLHHWPDNTKSRSSYLPLLELAVKEEPTDDRSSHYYGRELMYYGRHEAAIEELKRHLSLPNATWCSERAASMRFISRCYQDLGKLEDAKAWALRACGEDTQAREPWYELMKVLYKQQDWPGLFGASLHAFKFTDKGKTYICDPDAWSYMILDYAAIGAYHAGFKQAAATYGAMAIEAATIAKEPEAVINRLTANAKFYA